MPDANDQSDSSTKNTRGPQGQSDDPRQAKESGDPQAEGRRTGGRPADEDAGAASQPRDSKDWESGRHQAR